MKSYMIKIIIFVCIILNLETMAMDQNDNYFSDRLLNNPNIFNKKQQEEQRIREAEGVLLHARLNNTFMPAGLGPLAPYLEAEIATHNHNIAVQFAVAAQLEKNKK